jgi:hypothetical protein
MKNITLFFILSIFSFDAKCQDIIITLSGDEIKTKVIEITSAELKYKKYENINGPIYNILKSDVLMVKYENGSKDIFTTNITNVPSLKNENICQKAERDAYKYYKNYSGAATGTLVATVFGGGILGLIPAIMCSSTPPTQMNLNMPVQHNQNPEYVKCYTEYSRKMKAHKVWSNFGIGCGVLLLFLVIKG